VPKTQPSPEALSDPLLSRCKDVALTNFAALAPDFLSQSLDTRTVVTPFYYPPPARRLSNERRPCSTPVSADDYRTVSQHQPFLSGMLNIFPLPLLSCCDSSFRLRFPSPLIFPPYRAAMLTRVWKPSFSSRCSRSVRTLRSYYQGSTSTSHPSSSWTSTLPNSRVRRLVPPC